MPAKLIDLTGQVFGKLTAIERVNKKWVCLCVCGRSRALTASALRAKQATSCKDCRKKSYTKEYKIWRGIINRCENKNQASYKYYGALGVSVCERWRNSFDDFMADMGPRPSNRHSVDRFPNMTGNYEPGNVRWATYKQQAGNKTTNTVISYRGKQMILQDVAEDMGVLVSTLSWYLKSHSIEQAIEHYAHYSYKQRGPINYLKLNT